MRCLIIDDESLARVEMHRLLSQAPEVEVIGEAADVQTALDLTALHRPDLVFIDVQLRGETGFDYVARLQEPLPHLVFVTAFDHYAVRGFECNALDYLLKPVEPGRLSETLRRVHTRKPVLQRATDYDDVFVKTSSVARFIPWKRIEYIVSDGNYTRLFLEKSPPLVVLRPLKEWLDLAPEREFLQIHRTTVVRRTQITEVQNLGENRRRILLSNGANLPIGRAFWPAVKALVERR